jgi:hypothetical protein
MTIVKAIQVARPGARLVLLLASLVRFNVVQPSVQLVSCVFSLLLAFGFIVRCLVAVLLLFLFNQPIAICARRR